MTRAVGYIRTATTTQTEREHCTGAQAQRIRRYCKAHNIALVGSFADYGVGGNEIERKGLRDALSLLKDGQADLLVTVNVSRLSRSVGALAKLVDAHFSRVHSDPDHLKFSDRRRRADFGGGWGLCDEMFVETPTAKSA
jgi:hypothetical protein